MREGFMKEDYLATALSAVGEAVIAIDSSGSVRHLNAAAERLVGQSLAAVRGKAFRDVFRLLPLSDHGVPGDAVRATLRDGKRVTLAPRTALAVPGLADQQVNGRTVPLFDDRGRVDGAILVLSEASEESSIREELRVREERLKSIFLAAPVGIGLVKHQVIMDANDRLCEICGYSRAELTHQSALMLYPSEEEYERVGREKYRQIAAKGTGTVETRWRHKDGRLIDVLLSSTPLEADDLSQGVTFTALDITERKRIEAALRESEEQFRRLFEESYRTSEVYRSLLNSSADAIVIYDLKGRVRFVNPSFTRIFGWPLEELAGRRIPFVPESEREASMAEIRKVLSGTPSANFETRRLDKQGRLLDIALSGSRFDDHRGVPEGMLVILHDLSHMKTLEAQYRQAQKMEAIGTLAGGIAHDFNNLLHAMTGYAQLLLWGKGEGDPGFRELEQIQKVGGRAAKLIRQLLTFSRKVEGERRVIDLNRAVYEAQKVLKRTIPKMIAIELDLGERLWPLTADPVQVEQILFNLGSNAADAMQEGGRLTIGTRNVVLDESLCREHLGLVPGDYLLLIVSDTGHGMDSETVQHIFEPFFTTKEVGKGTGLGLASVYGIVKSHAGIILCDSAVGKGTRFRIYLPASVPDPTTQAREADESSHLGGGSETILVVDDEPFIRELASQALKRYGYRPILAASGEEALELYQATPSRFDLVLLDLGMPGMGGQKCLQEIVRLQSTARVIIASGYADGQQQTLQQDGAAAFIAKPYDLKALANTVRQVLDKTS